jgi:hypothetical protein
MQVIVYSQENGQVAVCYPTNELPIEELLSRDCPQGAVIVDNDSLPNEHDEFFDAWELNGSTVSINLTKAKEITKTRLRAEREPLLLAQDVLFQRALETNLDTSTIVAEKQRLRDITNLADVCTTTAELKALSC